MDGSAAEAEAAGMDTFVQYFVGGVKMKNWASGYAGVRN